MNISLKITVDDLPQIKKFEITEDDLEQAERYKILIQEFENLCKDIRKNSFYYTNLTFDDVDEINYSFICVRTGNTAIFHSGEDFYSTNLSELKTQADIPKDINWKICIPKIENNIKNFKRETWFRRYFRDIEPNVKEGEKWLNEVIKPTFENPEDFEFMLKTLAFKLKNGKSQHNFAFYGERSTGKTLFGKVIMKIFKEGYCSESLNIDNLNDKFNACIFKRLFINFDELPVSRINKNSIIPILKRLTADKITVEQNFQIKNDINLNYFINCNCNDPRCYGLFVFNSKTEFESLIGKQVHICKRLNITAEKNMIDLIDDKTIILGIREYLLNYDLTDYNDRMEDYLTVSDKKLLTLQKFYKTDCSPIEK